ncbi:hypothetical protein [Streptococcus acidominimus]|uniref:Uncharacterized protein n=1 Tax=Streptococcus acidominimus TaxID=1326 RepID=A0A4Y9FTK8_STRAI|nr:hypothetical protein [Streptococcus acidominimus]MBF0817872.1 hypothetical protein [Streptococcus acidominimus]MBF0838388.1 hypothetical protein [Streptococcus acidominimus]MBF0846249.1 hypothetical protein [Streptococcus danieliae]TFU31860.1 hypothetical protein E4U01_00120 [Streptococcus acidominimus]
MTEFDKFLENIGDPFIAGGTIIGIFIFIFKKKKPKAALGVFFGGVAVYYIAHNAIAVFKLFGPTFKAILEWFARAITG